ncbi:MAG: hypothetical protein IJZ96_05415, partial [Lachnospiraceae bacterium]|nr:hypothetical protein [Lachnospiraceae bacterium]
KSYMPAKTKIQRDNQENPGSGGKKNPICPPKQKSRETTRKIRAVEVRKILYARQNKRSQKLPYV